LKKAVPIIFILFTLTSCFGPFKKTPVPEPEPVAKVLPAIDDQWLKINILTPRDEVIKLVGKPLFVDIHKVGEDWYYDYTQSTIYAIVSFPRTGYLVDRVQYFRYPEWR